MEKEKMMSEEELEEAERQAVELRKKMGKDPNEDLMDLDFRCGTPFLKAAQKRAALKAQQKRPAEDSSEGQPEKKR